MIDRTYLNNISDSKTNVLHNSKDRNLTDFLSNPYLENEFDNLVLNSNLDNSNIIK